MGWGGVLDHRAGVPASQRAAESHSRAGQLEIKGACNRDG